MPQDVPDAVSPLAPFEGRYQIPGFELWRHWFDARELTPQQRDEILELIDVSFNGIVSWYELPVSRADHLEWKFRDRPVGATVHTTEDADGHIVGFSGGVRRVWSVRGRRYVSRGGFDLCLSPTWQGQGVQRAINPHAKREWHPSEDIGLGYVTHPADRHLALESGNWAPANETHDYIRQLRPLRRLQRMLPRRRRAGDLRPRRAARSRTALVIRAGDRGRFDRPLRLARRAGGYAGSLLARRPAPRGRDWTISTLSRFEARHEAFVAAALSQFDFVAERPIEYLNWRYLDERAGPFTVRVAERGGETLGYAVTRVLHGAGYLADILALPGRADVAESLIRDAIELANRGDAAFLRTRLPMRHPYSRALRRTGFFDVGHVAGEMVAPRRIDSSELAFLGDASARIHIVAADSDAV